MLRRSVSLTLLVGLFVATGARPALAGCTQASEAKAVKRSLKLAVRCNNRILRAGPGITCRQSAAPACAGTLIGDAVALAYGAEQPARLPPSTRRPLKDAAHLPAADREGRVDLRRDASCASSCGGLAADLADAASATPARPLPDRCA